MILQAAAAVALIWLASGAAGAAIVEVDVEISVLTGEHPCPEAVWADAAKPVMRDMLQNRWPFKLWNFQVRANSAATVVAAGTGSPLVRAVVTFNHQRATAGFLIFAGRDETNPRGVVSDDEKRPTDCKSIGERLRHALNQKEQALKDKLLENVRFGSGVDPGLAGEVILHAPPEVGKGVFEFPGYPIEVNAENCKEQEVRVQYQGWKCEPTPDGTGVVAYRTKIFPQDCESYVTVETAELKKLYFYLSTPPNEGDTPRSCRNGAGDRSTPAPTVLARGEP